MKARHTSLDKQLKQNVLWLESQDGVSKVVLGISNCCRHKYPPGHIKVRSLVSGGIKVNGYSGKGITDMFIRVSPLSLIETIAKKIETRFILKK